MTHVPTDAELSDWIATESRSQPAGCAIGYQRYKLHHPSGWCGIARLLSSHGLRNNAGSWRRLVSDVTGLHVMTSQEWTRHYRATVTQQTGPRGPYRRWDDDDDVPEPAEHPYERYDALYADGDGYGFGLKVRARLRNVLQWDWQKQMYVTVGTEERLVVV